MNRILSSAAAVALLLLGAATTQEVAAQGCVAIRHFSSCTGGTKSTLSPGEFLFGVNYRYFESFRHFKGTVEQEERVELNTEVVNWSHALDLNATYGVTNQLYATVTLPLVYNIRSSLYEHGRASRHETSSMGLADMRVGAGYWLLDPESYHNGNVAVGLGLKIPTGNAGATDFFHNVGADGSDADTLPDGEIRPVDQSIQPGDGGWGVALDFQAFHTIVGTLGAYAGGFYLINPRDTNETFTSRGRVNEHYMSVPDQFSVRAGLTLGLPVTGLGAALGARYEGVPVEDLIGESNGFRRPGMVLSLEPGLSYGNGPFAANLSVPVALYRNRTRSITDIANGTNQSGEPIHGDAAFSDYLINLGVTYRIGGALSDDDGDVEPLPMHTEM